jgi:hypothetical protein
MKHSSTWFASILIASALLLSVANRVSAQSPNPRRENHKGTAEPKSEQGNQRPTEPSVPLAAFQGVESALADALHTVRAQEEAATKDHDPQKDRWDKAAVISNYLLFLVACLYTYFAWGQWDVIDKQVRIANETLILANRPRIKVRTFVIKPRNKFVWNLAIDLECQVVNSGGVEAYIVESNCTVFTIGGLNEGLPMLPPYSNQTDSFKVKNDILPAGLACPLYQPSEIMLMSANDELVAKGEIKLYAIGYILYRDKLRNFYRTAFCRRFNFEKKRFEIILNHDYEHQD